MDDLDVRLRVAYRSLTEPSDLDESERTIAAAIRVADRRSRGGTAGRFAVAAAAVLVVVGGTAIIMGRPAPTEVPSDATAASQTIAPHPTGSPLAATPPRLTWNRQPLDGAAGPGTMSAIAAGGGTGLVAVGWDIDTSHHHNTPTSERHHIEALAWPSTGGASWLRVAGQPAFEHAAVQDVASARSVLVAVGYSDSDPDGIRQTRLWSSLDGTNWTVLPDSTVPADTRLSRLLGTAGGFLASGVEAAPDGHERGVVWGSEDGATWARLTGPAAFGNARLGAIFETGGELVAIGDLKEDLYSSRPVLWRSLDGSRWEAIELPDGAFGNDVAGIEAIVAGGPGYIAVGTVIDKLSPQSPDTTIAWPPTDGGIWTSPDLRMWTRVEPARESFGGEENQVVNSIVAIRNGYIAFGSTGTAAGAWSSDDGERWGRFELPESTLGKVYDAIVMNGAVIAVGGADDIPAVWRGYAGDAANSPAAVEGVAYPISVYTHCGLDRSRFDFDGSFWRPIGNTSDGQGNPPGGYDNPYDAGSIVLLPDGAAEYTSGRGARLRLERRDGAPTTEACY